MNKSYFCSERVRLRAMEPEDLEVMYAMENDSQTWDVTNFTVPYSRFVLKQYIENSECDMFADRQLRMMIVRAEDDALIGTIDITEFSPMHARGEVGIAIRKEYQGNGYAKEALRLLCDYVFSFLYLASPDVPFGGVTSCVAIGDDDKFPPLKEYTYTLFCAYTAISS